MSRKSKVVELLIERRLTDADMQYRNQALKDRLDKIGSMLNAFKQKWNVVNQNPNAQINEKDYVAKEFEQG